MQPITLGEHDDRVAMNGRDGARQHDQTAIRLGRKSAKALLDVRSVAHTNGSQLHADGSGCIFESTQKSAIRRQPVLQKGRDLGRIRRDLLEQFQPFRRRTELLWLRANYFCVPRHFSC